MLGTARSTTFATPEGQRLARDTIAKNDLGGLLVIGGNGSLTGARTLADVTVAARGEVPAGKLIVGGRPRVDRQRSRMHLDGHRRRHRLWRKRVFAEVEDILQR